MSYETFDVAVEGGNLRVGRWGTGAEMVLAAHGITGNHLHFGNLAAQIGAEFTLVAPDLRGRGRSSEIVGPFSMAAHAADLVAVLDFLEVDRATLVGHSMGGFAGVVCADQYPDRVRSLVLVDGGIPLELGPLAELPTDQLLAGLIGPALDRLRRTFESVAAYFEYWQQHPAMVDAWNPHLEQAFAYDLGGEPPELRSTVREDAVIADAESELDHDDVAGALARLTKPTVLLRAERGIMNQTPPLYPDDAMAHWLDSMPLLRSVQIADTNHYTILLTDRGAKIVSDALEQLLL